VNGGTPDTANSKYWGGNMPWVTGADFTSSGIGEIRRYVSEAGIRSSSTNVVHAGNLLLVTRTGVGKLAIAPCDIAISQDITGVYLDENEADTGFTYFLMERGVEDLKKRNQGTSINGIIRSDLEGYVVQVPCSLTEQKRIASVLATVESSIEKTESLIAKYQQIKAGLMHDLFTHGVTADGKLRPPREQAPELYKETPIGWIPKEWRVEKLGWLSEIVSGVTLGTTRSSMSGITVPYLRVANVQDGYLDLSEVKTITVTIQELEKLRLKDGDVLMNEGGDFDKLGRGTVWRGEISDCVHQNHVFRVRPQTETLRSDYLAFWSQSQLGKKYFVLSSKQSTNLASINSTQLNAFPIAVPIAAEQDTIENRIIAVVSRIENFVKERTKLNYIKQGLMHDLLTGRVSASLLDVIDGGNQ
jgi:type I restriction enzyme S subunit